MSPVGRVLLVFRLVLADVRRHPGQAAMLLVSITAATAAMALGLSLHGATGVLYERTRAATAGPDIVALSPGGDRTATSALESLTDAPGVVAHTKPSRQYYTNLVIRGATANTVVESAEAEPGPIDRPLVTSGTWVRPGGAVIERGFASALKIRVGDRVTFRNRTLPVVGIAVTAAHPVFPWAQMIGPGGGPGDSSGLAWLDERDAGVLAAKDVPVTSTVGLKLRDPGRTAAFIDSRRDPAAPVTFFSWQFLAHQDAVMLDDSLPSLVLGSWMLNFLAIAGVTVLAAGRAAGQTRRAGLLKAVGGGPGLIAAVLLAEYLTLALVAEALGLAVARLAEPSLVNPTDGLLSGTGGPSGGTIAATTVLALGVAALTTLGPTVRALRTETVTALAEPVRPPRHRPILTGLSALLPTALLLGLRLTARRPGRAVLNACGTAVTMATSTALLMGNVQHVNGYDLGSVTLNSLKFTQGRHVLLGVSAAVIVLAVVNTLTATWTTAQEARPTMAIARTLGATPGQVTAGLSVAQLVPAVPGAVAGVPMGWLIYVSLGPADIAMPPTWSFYALGLAPLVATAVLTAVPARVAARRPVAPTLSAEAS